MKYLIRAFISLCLIAIAVIGLQFVASERVEVVILESMNADGQPQETRLWIVDDAGYQYLRASADAGWYQRLVANPHISVERNGQRRTYIAVPDLEKTLVLNQLMNSKYTWGDDIIDYMVDRKQSIAVALQPLDPDDGKAMARPSKLKRLH